MKFLLVLSLHCFLLFSVAVPEPTTDEFVEKLMCRFQTALLTTPYCVTKNCPQVNAVDCQQRKAKGLQFTTQVIQAVAKCQSNVNGVCGTSINRINIRDLLFRVSDSPLITCYVNNDDSYFYNADQLDLNIYESQVNLRKLPRRWYQSTWNNLQYRGSFSCYSYGCDYAPVATLPSFNLGLQINFTARAISGVSLYNEDCIDDSVLDWIPYSNVAVGVTACNSQYCKPIQTNIENSLKGNDFGYTLGTRFNNLVTNALISKLRACTGGNSTIC